MSTTVDQRVVEMRFDNKQFESAAQTSLNTLEKLKKSLNLEGSSKGLEELKRASSSFSLDGMMSAVDALNNRFSTMGIVGMTVISNLTTAAMRFAKSMWDKTIGQIQSGGLARAMNIEQARFQLQGLHVEWDKISEDINYGVRDTAYGLDAAAKAASQLVASGVQFGDTFGETGNSPMAKALRGISGVAAMTNSSYEEISHIFTTVAGQGKLMGMQLQQFANRGLNVAATLGEQLGYTETEIREFVTKGKIDFATFSEAMDRAFGDQATKANETYSGSLSNVKAALSRIGAKVATVYLEKMRDVFNALRPAINKVSEALDPFINLINSGIGKVSERVVKWLNRFTEVLTFMVKPITKVKEATEEVKKTVVDLAHVEEMAWKVIRGDYGNGQKRIDALRAEGECYELIQNKVNELLGCDVRHEVQMESSNKTLEEKAEDIAEVSNEYANLWYWYYKIQGISDNAYKIFSNIKDSLSGIASAIGKAFKESNFRPLAKFVSGFVNQIRIFTKNFKMGEESSNSLTSTFKGLISVLKLLAELFMFAAEAAMILISPIFDIVSAIGRLTGIFGDLTTAEVDAFEATDPFRRAIHNLRKLIEPLRKAIRKLTDTLLGSIDADEKASKAGSILSTVFSTVCKIFESLWEALTFVANKLIDGAKKIKKYVTENEKLQNVLLTLKEAFMTIGGIILNVATNIGAFIKGFMDLPVVKKMIENVGNAFDKAYDLIKPFLDEAANKVEEFGNKLKSVDGATIETMLSNINTHFENFSTRITTAWNSLKAFFDSGDKASGLLHTLENLGEDFENIKNGSLFSDAISGGVSDAFDFEGAKDKVTEFTKDFKGKLGEINIGKVLGITFGSASVVSLLNFASLEKSLSKMAGSFAGVSDSIAGAITNLFGITKKKENFSTTAIKLAAAIGILAGSLYFLAGIPAPQLKSAVDSLLAVITAFGALAATMNVLSKTVAFKGKDGKGFKALSSNVGEMMLEISGSILLLVLALKVLEHVDIGKAKDRFGMLIGLVAMVTGMAVILSRGGKDIQKGGLTLLFMAIAVDMLAKTLIRLSNADMKNTNKALKSLSVIMLMLGALALTAGRIKFSAGAGLLAMVTSLILLEKALMYIAEDFDYGAVVGNLRKFILIFGIMFTLGILARVIGKNGLTAGVGMLAMAASIYALGKTMQLIAKIDKADLDKARKTIIALIIALGAAGAVVGYASKGGDFKTIIAIALAMGILVAELIILTNVDWADLWHATVALAGILVAFGFAIGQISSLNKKNTGTIILTFVGMIALIGMIAGVLSDLAQYDWKSIAAAGAAMSLTIFAVGKAFEAIGKAKDVDQAKVTNFILASVSLIPIAIAISMVADKPWQGILAATVPLCACLLAIAVAFKIINGTVINQAGVVAFIAGALSLLIIAGAIKILASEDWRGILAAAGSLSLVLIALSVSLVILSGVGGVALGALGGIAVLDILIIDLLGLLELIGSFTDFEAAEKGIEALALIGKAIGEFIGSIVGGFGEAVTASLPQIGTNLSTFADNVDNFVDKVSNVKGDVAEGAVSLAGAILSITGGGLLSAFRKEGSVEEFGQHLLDFGEYIAQFYTNLVEANVEPLRFSMLAKSVSILATMAQEIPNSGGKLADWIGDNSLKKFGEDLKDFGPNLASFASDVSGLSNEDITAAAESAKVVAEFASAIPNSGGKLAELVGENSLTAFGEELVDFGPNFAAFANSIKDVKPETIEAASNAAKTVAEFASAIPNSGGKLADWIGDNTLSSFAEELEPFGKAFSRYAESVSGITQDTVEASSAAAQSVIAFANEVPNEGGLLGVFAGNNSLSAFGEELAAFGSSFSEYATNVSGVTPEVVDQSISAANTIMAFKNSLGESNGGWWQNLTGKASLSGLGQQIAGFGSYIGRFYESIKGLSGNKVNAFANIMETLKTIGSTDGTNLSAFSDGLTKLGTEGIQNFLTGFEDADDKVKDSITTLFKSIVDAVKSKSMQLQNAGKSAGAKFLNGLSLSVSNATYIGSRYVAAFIEGLRSGSGAIEQIGANMGLGLARGIASQHDNIVNQATKNATDAATAMAKATQVQSPSKVTYRIGRYVGMGFMLGIKALSDATVNTAEELADDTVTPFSTAINMISDAINSDMEMDPTIRPVVDLTNVTDSANRINAMFSTKRAISVASGFKANGAAVLDGESAAAQTFNFTQNNYSPKALSRLEIYRQTRNQFAQMKGAVSGT